MMQELDNKNMSDVSVIQNASLNLKKLGPPRLILSLAGLVFGLRVGLLQAVVRDARVAMTPGPSSPTSDRDDRLPQDLSASQDDRAHSGLVQHDEPEYAFEAEREGASSENFVSSAPR